MIHSRSQRSILISFIQKKQGLSWINKPLHKWECPQSNPKKRKKAVALVALSFSLHYLFLFSALPATTITEASLKSRPFRKSMNKSRITMKTSSTTIRLLSGMVMVLFFLTSPAQQTFKLHVQPGKPEMKGDGDDYTTDRKSVV